MSGLGADGIVLKLSGRYLAADGFLWNADRLARSASVVAEIANEIGVAVVIGGGNVLAAMPHVDSSRARLEDVGRRGCALNMTLLADALERLGVAFTQVSLEHVRIDEIAAVASGIAELVRSRSTVLVTGTLGLVGVSSDFVAVELAALIGASDVLFTKNGITGIVDSRTQRPLERRVDSSRVIPNLAVDEAMLLPTTPIDRTALAVAASYEVALRVIAAGDIAMVKRVVAGDPVGTMVGPARRRDAGQPPSRTQS